MGPVLFLLLFAFAPNAASGPAPGAAARPSMTDADIREIRCRIMVAGGAGKPAIVAAPDLHVLRQAATAGPFRPALPAGAKAIICERSSIIPAAHDDEVPALGLSLFLSEPGKTGRLAVLESIAGHLRFRMLDGEMKPREEPLIEARLDQFRTRK